MLLFVCYEPVLLNVLFLLPVSLGLRTLKQ